MRVASQGLKPRSSACEAISQTIYWFDLWLFDALATHKKKITF